jgi:maltooligosyltrehalose trehalohydrolase
LAGELGSPCHLIAESADNDPRLVNTEQAGGFGLDAQWNDDFHHALHTVLTGEKFGYYIDYGSPADLARAMDSGFVYQGEHSVFRRRRHGAASVAIAPERFVIFAQNHDHIGNRPRGDRLASLVSTDRARLVAALVILAPGIPLLFMGEEYGETAPFPYFIDHGDPALIDAVRKGRAAEFSALAQQGQLYDPAARSTFEVARIDRSLRHKGEHASLFELYGDLIALRRQNPALRRSPRAAAHAYIEGGVLIAERTHPEDTVMTLFNLTGDVSAGTLTVETSAQSEHRSARPWHNLLDPDAPVMVEGARVSLEPWGFAVYHLGTEAGGEKGVTR